MVKLSAGKSNSRVVALAEGPAEGLGLRLPEGVSGLGFHWRPVLGPGPGLWAISGRAEVTSGQISGQTTGQPLEWDFGRDEAAEDDGWALSEVLFDHLFSPLLTTCLSRPRRFDPR